MAPLAAVTSLRSVFLALGEATRLSNLGSLAALPRLRQLRMSGHYTDQQIHVPASPSKLTSLRSLEVSLCSDESVSELQGISCLQGLRSVVLPPEGVHLCPSLTSLQQLCLYADDTGGLPGLTSLTQLEHLELKLPPGEGDGEQYADDLVFVNSLQRLRILHLSGWQAGFDGLQHSELTSLKLSELETGEHCLDLEECASLTQLVVSACEEGVVVVPLLPARAFAVTVGGSSDYVRLLLQAGDLMSGRVSVTAATR